MKIQVRFPCRVFEVLTWLVFNHLICIQLLLDSNIKTRSSRPFPSCLVPLFQSESRCSAFHGEMSFHSHANKKNSLKGCAIGLALKKEVQDNSEMAYLFNQTWTKLNFAHLSLTSKLSATSLNLVLESIGTFSARWSKLIAPNAEMAAATNLKKKNADTWGAMSD